MLKYLGITLLFMGFLYPVVCYRKYQERKMADLTKYLQIVNNCSTNAELYADTLPQILKKTFGQDSPIANKEELLNDISLSNVPRAAKELLEDFFISFGKDTYSAECKKARECLSTLEAIINREGGEGQRSITALGALLCAAALSGVILLL